MLATGVYLIKNKYNNKIYVGSTSISFNSRFSAHLKELNGNRHRNKHLQQSYNKYGKDGFEFIILEICQPSDCIEREQYYLNTLIPEYNICKIAGSRLGVKQGKDSPEVIAKRMKAMKDSDTPERIAKRKERARKLGISNRGKKQPPHIAERLRTCNKRFPVIAKNKITGEELNFSSVGEASRYLKMSVPGIIHSCNNYGKIKPRKEWLFKWQM